MNKNYQKLEFDVILNQVSKHALLTSTKDLILNLKPKTEYEEVQAQLDQTSELMSMFFSYGSYKLEGLHDMSQAFNALKRKEILDGLDLYRISSISDVLNNITLYYNELTNKEKYPYFTSLVEDFNNINEITKQIKHMIDSSGLVYEDANETLKRLKTKIEANQVEINNYLQGFIKSNSDHLTDNIISTRNNRYVVMVKASSKNIIKGIIHDESNSKETVFIEPTKVIELNNEIQSLEHQRLLEIEKILRELTYLVYENMEEIISNYELLLKLDYHKALVEYTIEIDGTIPTINKDSAKLEIFNGRHPLIDKDKVVSNDFFLCNNETKYRIVLISGSNTGGKTVSLKMIGLFSLMAQCGIGISASDTSNLPIYKDIFVDIGDEQSIVNSLSTFSSHLVNVANILDNVSMHSLVLLDELGSGTNPSQGENLAIAILDYLYQKDASVVVSTHYTKLKNYAIEKDYVRSASVLFDEKSNKPQYQLSFDTYASSNAFEIALMLGLNKDVIEHARMMYESQLDTSDELLLKLSQENIEVLRLKEEFNEKLSNLENEKKKLVEKEKKLNEKFELEILKAKEEANRIISETKLQSEMIIDDLKKQDKFVNHEVNKITNVLNEISYDTNDNVEEEHDFEVGDHVLVKKVNSNAVIIEVLKNDRYLINMGNLSTKVKKSEIKFLSKKQVVKQKKTRTSKYKSKNVSTELNLIGLRADEASIRIDKYLDDAILSGLKRVRIVHGFGTGVLRSLVQDKLRKNKNVVGFRFAEYNEGGQGATIVEIK